MGKMNKENFIEEIKKLNIEVNETKLNLLEEYYLILEDYNKHTNLTRIIDKNDVYLKHFYDSLTITKVIDLNSMETVLDFGSGAGFPGVVLKIFFPNIKLTLLDSNNKKTKFLEYLCKKLNIEAEIVNERAENFTKKRINSFDVVVARAVANLRVLSELSIPLIKLNGNFIAMKANSELEIKETETTLEIMNSKIVKNEQFYLVDESPRSIILITKNKNTKLSNLRLYDKILKQPLEK